MSHDRGCPCGKEPYEYKECRKGTDCIKNGLFGHQYGFAIEEVPTTRRMLKKPRVRVPCGRAPWPTM